MKQYIQDLSVVLLAIAIYKIVKNTPNIIRTVKRAPAIYSQWKKIPNRSLF